MNRFKPIAFSFFVSLSIAFVFLMATFAIFAFSGPDGMKDALSTTGSYFGAVSTLGAAVIAAYLFDDWRAENKAVFIQKFYHDLRSETFLLYESYLKLKTFLLDPSNKTLSEDYYRQFYKLEGDFLFKADYVEQILDDFIYILKRENNPSYKKYASYRKGLLKAKAFFEVNDPREDYLTYHALIKLNIKNGTIEKGIAELKHLLSLDLIDDILNEMR